MKSNNSSTPGSCTNATILTQLTVAESTNIAETRLASPEPLVGVVEPSTQQQNRGTTEGAHVAAANEVVIDIYDEDESDNEISCSL